MSTFFIYMITSDLAIYNANKVMYNVNTRVLFKLGNSRSSIFFVSEKDVGFS